MNLYKVDKLKINNTKLVKQMNKEVEMKFQSVLE